MSRLRVAKEKQQQLRWRWVVIAEINRRPHAADGERLLAPRSSPPPTPVHDAAMSTKTPADRHAAASAHYRDLVQRRLRATKRLTADLASQVDSLAAHSPQLAEVVRAVLTAAGAEQAELLRGRHDPAKLAATESAMERFNAALTAEENAR